MGCGNSKMDSQDNPTLNPSLNINKNVSFRCIYEIKDDNEVQIINDTGYQKSKIVNEEIKSKIKIINNETKEELISKKNLINLDLIISILSLKKN